MKICELCKSLAKVYCESDEANLCWTCDFKVHSANFLVARHSRNLLCRTCQSPTPWNAAGEKIGRIVCVCEKCVDDREESHGGNDDEIGSDVENDGDDHHQVVPLSNKSPPALVAAAASWSSRKECSGGRDICLKQVRKKSLDLCTKDNKDSLPLKSLKRPRTESTRSPRDHEELASSRSEVTLKGFHGRYNDREDDDSDCDSDSSVSS